MSDPKILPVNPGSIDRLPPFTRRMEAPVSIAPLSGSLARMFGAVGACCLRGSYSRLLLRIVAAVFIIGGAVMQMRGELDIFGLERHTYIYGVAALVLGAMMCLGLMGRYAALVLTVLAVMSLMGYAAAHGGVADFSAPNQLSLVSGALTAMVAVLGPGRLTLSRLLFSRRRR